MKIVILFSLLIIVSHCYVGDRLLRNFFSKAEMPLTVQAKDMKDYKAVTGVCDPKYGIQYAFRGEPTRSNPTFLFFTSAGQIAGFGVKTWRHTPKYLQPNYWMPGEDDTSELFVSFRNESMMCSGKMSEDILGDRVYVNQRYPVPMSAGIANQSGWVMGNCINGMGIHYAYDIAYPGKQSWNAHTLFPLQPMYDSITGHISAVLLTNPNLERVWPVGDWEGPFFNFLYCKNWCADTGCKWDNTNTWSTMHWLFGNPDLQQCVGAPCSL